MDSSSDRDKNSTTNPPQPKTDNPFIKFRQFADAQIGSLLQGILGLPSAFSKPTEDTRWAVFDEDLRRRDELQARQKELKESEARRQDRQMSDDGGAIPVRKSTDWRPSPGWNDQAPAKYQDENNEEMDPVKAREIPLYSPITKSLFAHLRQRPEEDDNDWKQTDLVESTGWVEGLLGLHSMLNVRPDSMRTLQSMFYNELNRKSTYRSEYSLLPYLLFSPYSPIRLSTAPSVPNPLMSKTTKILQDDFPYLDAFEDLIKTTQQQPQSSHGMQLFKPTWRVHMGDPIFPISQIGLSLAWIYYLHQSNILQEKEVRNVPGPSPIQWPDHLEPRCRRQRGAEGLKGAQNAQTEEDMYEQWLQWASSSSPVAVGDVFEGLAKFVGTNTNEASKTIREIFDAKFTKELKEVSEMVGKFEAQSKSEKVFEKIATTDRASMSDDDPDRVVSSSTTTERTTDEDGTVETCVTVWKRFADGRETTTTTSHTEDPAWDEDGKAKPRREPVAAKAEDELTTKAEEKKTEKKGWFWN
jgi:hypothetical protein